MHKNGLNYPTPLVDKKTGRVHLFYNEWQVGEWYTYSTDGGRTWAESVRASGAIERYAGMGGAQLASGRMVLPCQGEPNGVAACYSDDGAKTWRRGKTVVTNSSVATVTGSKALDFFGRPLDGTDLSAEDDGLGASLGTFPGANIGFGLGETSMVADGRGPNTLTLFSRAGERLL